MIIKILVINRKKLRVNNKPYNRVDLLIINILITKVMILKIIPKIKHNKKIINLKKQI